MTEENKIIVDGVDVSQCENLNACKQEPQCVLLQEDVMNDNTSCTGYNCYYKQLKRKEQECKELKEENFNFEQLINLYEKDELPEVKDIKIKQLQQKLDNTIKDLKNICETSCFNIITECEYPKCNNDKCSIYQALKRIEE